MQITVNINTVPKLPHVASAITVAFRLLSVCKCEVLCIILLQCVSLPVSFCTVSSSMEAVVVAAGDCKTLSIQMLGRKPNS